MYSEWVRQIGSLPAIVETLLGGRWAAFGRELFSLDVAAPYSSATQSPEPFAEMPDRRLKRGKGQGPGLIIWDILWLLFSWFQSTSAYESAEQQPKYVPALVRALLSLL